MEVVGVGVRVIAMPGLTGSTVTPAIMCYDSVAVVGQKEHLILPIVRAKRPTMREGDNLAGRIAPIFIVDVCAVLLVVKKPMTLIDVQERCL